MYPKKTVVKSWTDLVEETLGVESKSLRLRQRLVKCWNLAGQGSADRHVLKLIVRELEWAHLNPKTKHLKKLTEIETRLEKTSGEGK